VSNQAGKNEIAQFGEKTSLARRGSPQHQSDHSSNCRAIPGRAVATALWTAEKSISRDRWIQRLLTLPPLEKLNGALVFRRRSLGLERAKISAFPRLWIFLPRIQSILTGFQFPDHYVASLGGLSFDFNVPIGLTSPDFDTADAAPSRDY